MIASIDEVRMKFRNFLYFYIRVVPPKGDL